MTPTVDVLAAMQWAMANADNEEAAGNDLEERMRVRYRADFDDFMVLYAKLTQKQDPSKAVGWDGKGPCPTCKREADKADPGLERAKKTALEWLEAHGVKRG